MKKVINRLLKLALIIGILWYLIHSGRMNLERLSLLWESPLVTISAIAILMFWTVPLASLRWFLLLRAMGLKVGIIRSFLLTWIGNFFNIALPGAVSGDLIRGYYIVKLPHQSEKLKPFITLLVDRFIALFGLVVIAFYAILVNYKRIEESSSLQALSATIGVIFIGILLFFGIICFRFDEGKDPFIRLMKKLPKHTLFIKVYNAFKCYQSQKLVLFQALLLSILIHVALAYLFYMVVIAYKVGNLDFVTQLLVMPIGLITIAIPIAPGGIGLGHAAFESLYAIVGVEGGADIFNIFVVIRFFVFLTGCIPYLFYKQEFKAPENEEIA